MSREMEGFREKLEELHTMFPGRVWLKTSEIAKSAGMDRRTAIRKFGIGSGGMSVDDFARALCKANKNAAQRSSAVRR